MEVILEKNEMGNISVEIKDTGIEISEDFLPRIFDPFTQEEQGYTRSYDGSGLGLALVKKYCDMNRIAIVVKSKKDIGTMFVLSFASIK